MHVREPGAPGSDPVRQNHLRRLLLPGPDQQLQLRKLAVESAQPDGQVEHCHMQHEDQESANGAK